MNAEETRRLFIDVRMARHSGIGTYLRNLAPRVAKAMPEVPVMLLGAPPGEEAFPGMAAQPFAAGIYSLREQILPLGMGIGRADTYWCPHYNLPGMLRARPVVTVHDTFHLAMPELTGGRLKRVYAAVLFRVVAARAKRIICVSRSTADELIRLTNVDAGKLEIIHNGVDEFWFGGAAATPRPVAAPYFLFVGNVKPHKNLRRLLAAFRLLRKDLPEHRLIIVGKKDGFLTGDPAAFRDAESLGESVAFTGYVSDGELRSYLQHAAALVFPSLYEGFGLPILEAMAAGCPVVASDLAVHREIGRELPIFFSPYSEEKIAAALHAVTTWSSATREQSAAAGIALAQSFSWDRCARETARVLSEVLEA